MRPLTVHSCYRGNDECAGSTRIAKTLWASPSMVLDLPCPTSIHRQRKANTRWNWLVST